MESVICAIGKIEDNGGTTIPHIPCVEDGTHRDIIYTCVFLWHCHLVVICSEDGNNLCYVNLCD